MGDKGALRQEMRDRLRRLSAADRTSFGDRICERIQSLPEFGSARTILIYADLPEEVATSAIHKEADRRGISVIYPRCLPEGREMTLHRVESDAELMAGRYGIREPAAHCPTTEIAAIDIAFIPGIAWDRKGHRLGRGAGYYDRLLASPEWRAFRCGIFFSIQEAVEVPTDPWDVPLNAVVTEREVWRREKG